MRVINKVLVLVFLSSVASAEETIFTESTSVDTIAETISEPVASEPIEEPIAVPADTNPITAPASLLPQVEETASSALDTFSMDYFSLFYGPALGNISSIQPTPSGTPDPERPLLVKNYLSINYGLSNAVAMSATAFWHWVPVKGQSLSLKDPYLRVAHNQLLQSELFTWYADARFHLPVTRASRDLDMLAGFQTYQVLTYQPPSSRITLALYGTARYNWFGPQGYGYDVELYLGPNFSYQISSTVAFTLLYEMGASHTFGDPPLTFYNDGTDLEPGFSWAITPQIVLNPYINLYTGNRISWQSTSFGATLSWQFL